MITNDEINRLFEEVLQKITQDVRTMMEELWCNWSHLGVDDDTKVKNINQLIIFEKEYHMDVMSETRDALKSLQQEIDKLKQETEELSKYLSVDITIMDYKEDMYLIEYKKELEQQISGYREQVQQRQMKIERLLEWHRDLADKLGVTIQELQEVPLPSEEELDKLKSHLEALQAERDKRTEIFLNTQIEIKDIMEKLNLKPSNKFELMVTSALSVDFKVTDLNMDRLAKLHQDLQEKYEHTNNRVLELRERLSKLWECLEEDQVYRENFLHAHQGCHAQTEAALKEEIKRCELIKRQKIQVFVANVRTKIKLMWDAVMYSQREREEFVHYFQDVFTEDTLTLHEIYLDKITQFYNEHKQIFDMVMTRKNLWLKMTELEARATDPGRYQNRGGQLLREEKERKAITSKLPKIEEQLRELVSQYEARTGRTFTVDGKPLLQLITDEWETRKAERQSKLSARKQALTPSTPLLRSLAVSPLGKRNRTAAGLPAAADNKPPQKRQLITSSATKAVSNTAQNRSALKRSAISTVKRRISGRLAAKASDRRVEPARKKLDYGTNPPNEPKVGVSASILKYKRRSQGKRRSSRISTSTTQSHDAPNDPLMESTLTTYTDFKDRINEKKIGRSSMAQSIIIKIDPPKAEEKRTPKVTAKTPRNAMTPKFGNENIQHMNGVTPKSNLMYTPKRLTRSAMKLDHEGFATPRAPLSATKQNVHANTPPQRSKSHAQFVRVKNLPPII